MVIRIKEVVAGADTADEGMKVLTTILENLSLSNDVVEISFEDIQTATTSFVNAAFVPLLAEMSLETIKSRVRVTSSTRQINDMIKLRLTREGGSGVAA